MIDRRRLALWAFFYAAVLVYSSLVLNPAGVHVVPQPWDAAWHQFVPAATHWVEHGSDQRADWMANLATLIPLGFMTACVFASSASAPRRWAGVIVAALLCAALILAIKYLQIFVPPRTVTLNYIVAQLAGTAIGIAAFLRFRAAGPAWLGRRTGRNLHLLLGAYTVLLLLFFLLPFDFVLSGQDWQDRMQDLPGLLWQWPGQGRAPAVRLLLTCAEVAITIPVGALLSLRLARWPLVLVMLAGVALMAAVTGASLFVLSAVPTMAALGLRGLGVVLGAMLARLAPRLDLLRLRRALRWAVPALALAYLGVLLAANGLITTQWRTPEQAMAEVRGAVFVPLYVFYIVSKAQAAISVAVHAAMYAPVGVLAWLRGWSVAQAAVLAALLALAVEAARWLRPELTPDFNEVLVAALVAGLAVKVLNLLSHAEAAPDAMAPPRRAGGRELLAAAACLLPVAAVVQAYPLMPALLGGALALYAVALWWRPVLWLAVIPVVLPAIDLTPWTGWMFVTESDLFVLVTVAMLLLRTPLRAGDLWPGGWRGVLLLLVLLAWGASTARGLLWPAVPGGSDNPYLMPENALRLAKGVATALLLLPFLRQRQRLRGDGLRWLGIGMAAGLAVVSALVVLERTAFPGLLDFSSDYRVVGPFSGMHMGGGLIGAYLAMALPFLLVGRRKLGVLLVLLAGVLGVYAVAVTFARMAYAASFAGLAVAALGWLLARNRGRESAGGAWVVPLLLLAALGGALAVVTLDTDYMSARLGTLAPDLVTRENNWSGGLAMREDTPAVTMLGMGLGTYPRVALARAPAGGDLPTNFRLGNDQDRRFVAITRQSAFYFEQKIRSGTGPTAQLSMMLRPEGGPGGVSVILCRKLLLYSFDCHSVTLEGTPGVWSRVSAPLPIEGPPPLDLALNTTAGITVDIADVQLVDAAGRELVDNGDFASGLDRWFFSDDAHLAWRMKNQYLMTFFEGGVLGLLALLLLLFGGLAGAVQGLLAGERMAAPIAGALAAFLCSGLVDYLLEAPRLATVAVLIALAGLTAGERSERVMNL